MTRPARRRGLSLRLRLTLSYAGFLVVAGAAMFAVLIAVLRFIPDGHLVDATRNTWVPNRSDLLDVAIPLVTWGMVFLALVGLVGGWFLAGRMLRPLGPINEAVRRAGSGSLEHRIDLSGPDDELRRLADAFDDMLERLEHSFDEQVRFTANASHELRTPLAITKTMLEVARSRPADPDTSALLGRLDEVNDRSIAILESLLRLARADHAGVDRQPCVIDALVRDVAGRTTGPGSHLLLEPTVVEGDPGLLSQLVQNLLDNATIHGDPSVPVTVRTFLGPEVRPTLVVENAGPVLDTALVDTLTEPFVRGSGRTRGPAGSGLGLSVVASIAHAHGADLELRPRDGGGLRVTVRFQRTGSDSLTMSHSTPLRYPSASS